MKNGLIYPRLWVMMADGAEFEVQPVGPDQIQWELTAARNKWPDFQKTPALWQTYLAWHALKREGAIPPDTTWDWFRGNHRSVQPAEMSEPEGEDEEGALDAFPTDPEPAID